jgi:hypothetical protein
MTVAQRGEIQSSQDPVAIAKRERRYHNALGDQPVGDVQLPHDLQGLRVDRRCARRVGPFFLLVQRQNIMTSLTQRRGEHQARRAATNNNHFSFVGQQYFSFNRLSSSVVRSARARIGLWTVRVVSRASSRMPLPDPDAAPRPLSNNRAPRLHQNRASGPAASRSKSLSIRSALARS